MWPLLYLPKGEIKIEKLFYHEANLPGLIKDLSAESFNGYIEVLALHEKGLIVFYQGQVVSCYYEGTDELELTQEQIIRHFLQDENKERDTIINVYGLTTEIIEALSALETPKPIHRELESSFMDMNKLIETLARKKFTGVLRFYRIRNNTRLGNLLLKMNKISSDQLREAVRLQLSQGGAKRLGDALVEIKAIAPSELEDALDRQSYTRKGSDLEIAIALFFGGQFLGGYAQENAIIIPSLAKVLSWMTGTRDILLDIIDSQLPASINIDRLLQAEAEKKVAPIKPKIEEPATKATSEKAPPKPISEKNPTKPAPEKRPTKVKIKKDKSAINFIRENLKAAKSEIKEIPDEETFNWQADDLILEPNVSEEHPIAEVVLPDEEPVVEKKKPTPDQTKTNQKRDNAAIPVNYNKVINDEKMSIPPEPSEDEYEKSISLDSLIQEVVPTPIAASDQEQEVTVQESAEPISSLVAEIQAGEFESTQEPNTIEQSQHESEQTSEESIEQLKPPVIEPEQPSQDIIDLTEKVLNIINQQMGFIGKALFYQERKLAELPDRPLTMAQFRALVKRTLKTANRIAGHKKVTQIENALLEDMGVLM